MNFFILSLSNSQSSIGLQLIEKREAANVDMLGIDFLLSGGGTNFLGEIILENFIKAFLLSNFGHFKMR